MPVNFTNNNFDIFLVRLRFLIFKHLGYFIPNKPKLNFYNRSVIEKSGEHSNETIKENNSFNLLGCNVEGKYFWKQIPREFEYCRTSEELGAKTITLVEIFTKDNFKFVELCMPEGYGVVYMRLLQPISFMNSYYNVDYDDEALNLSATPQSLITARSVNKVEIYCRPFLREKSRILDIGCGFGDQLIHFRDKGHITKGIEPGKERALFGINNYGLDILNEQLESIQMNNLDLGEKYDLIYLNQVFEHLYNPVSLLRYLLSHLKDDGRVFIAIPNFNFEGILVKMLTPIHTHSYTSTGLVSVASSLGLKIEKNYSDELYNIMIFKRGDILVNPSGGSEITRQLIKTFGLNSDLQMGDKVLVSSNTLGLWTATLKCTTPSNSQEILVKNRTD
jgi:SAM-dependent methyltransferase